MIPVAAGVILTDDEARYLVEVLEHATRIAQPSARVTDITRRLRRTVDAASGGANGSAKGRALQPNPGEIRAHDLLTAGEASTILGCSTSNVRYLRHKGLLPAHRAGSRWLYPAATVVARAERLAAKRG